MIILLQVREFQLNHRSVRKIGDDDPCDCNGTYDTFLDLFGQAKLSLEVKGQAHLLPREPPSTGWFLDMKKEITGIGSARRR